MRDCNGEGGDNYSGRGKAVPEKMAKESVPAPKKGNARVSRKRQGDDRIGTKEGGPLNHAWKGRPLLKLGGLPRTCPRS